MTIYIINKLKVMKIKFCILITFICLSIVKMSAQVRLGAEIGMNVSSMAIKANSHNVDVAGGLSVDYLFRNGVTLQSGLYYSSKGASGLWDQYNYAKELRQADIHLGYIEIPLTVGYRIPVMNNVCLVPSVGAYFACGVTGYGEIDVIVSNEKGHSRSFERWDNPYKGFKELKAFDRFDSGFRFGLSGEISRFVISFAYDLGLKKVWSGFDTDSYKTSTHKMKNRTACISVGYKFNL